MSRVCSRVCGRGIVGGCVAAAAAIAAAAKREIYICQRIAFGYVVGNSSVVGSGAGSVVSRGKGGVWLQRSG